MSKGWLQDLEERVQEAAERLRSLREENERLETHCRQLEGRVEELEAAVDAAGGDGDDAAWREERDEIRGRVEKLVDHLAGLLDE
ncbi:MAG: cell division protein ZapB [Acidobacteriota bacterium]